MASPVLGQAQGTRDGRVRLRLTRAHIRFVYYFLFTNCRWFEYLGVTVQRWRHLMRELSRTERFAMTAITVGGQDTLLTPGQVAAMFHVDPKTVTRWAHAGRLGSLRTPGGHRRFRESEVLQLLQSLTTEATAR